MVIIVIDQLDVRIIYSVLRECFTNLKLETVCTWCTWLGSHILTTIQLAISSNIQAQGTKMSANQSHWFVRVVSKCGNLEKQTNSYCIAASFRFWSIFWPKFQSTAINTFFDRTELLSSCWFMKLKIKSNFKNELEDRGRGQSAMGMERREGSKCEFAQWLLSVDLLFAEIQN